MHTIYKFSKESGEGEFTVISEEPGDDVRRIWEEKEDVSCDGCIDLESDATMFPCDRSLRVF